MEYKIVSDSDSRRLILVYAGWAMDWHPFASLKRPGYDIAVVWNYSNLLINWAFTDKYDEIVIVAWSFGVYMAAITAYAIAPRTTARIAVNGTLFPVDNLKGIPEKVFNGTLCGLNERSLYKFYRRMTGTKDEFESFASAMPQRTISDVIDELKVFHPLPLIGNQPLRRWDVAIIGQRDAIIPPSNQWRAWAQIPYYMADEPHWIDMQRIIDRFVVDKDMTRNRFAGGFDTYADAALPQRRIVEELADAMVKHDIDRHLCSAGARVLEIGSGTGFLSRKLSQMCGPETALELWDLAGEIPTGVGSACFRRGDAELMISHCPDESLDVIASASTIQWFNSPTRFLQQCARTLVSGGYLVLSTFLAGNLEEVRAMSGRALPLPSLRQWMAMIPREFDIVYHQTFDIVEEFDDAVDVLRHLKATGVNSLGRGGADEHPVSLMRRLPQALHGKYTLTYKPFILILQRKQR